MGKETDNTAPDGNADQHLQELARALSPLVPGHEPTAQQWLANLIGEWAAFRDTLRRHDEELQEARALARDYRLRYQELFEFAPDGYLVTDATGLILEANFAAAELMQTRKEFLVGKPLGLLIAAGERQGFYTRLESFGRRLDATHRWEVTLQRLGRPAHIVEAVVTANPFRDRREVVLRWLLRDVTAQRQAERALRAERNSANTVFQQAHALILVLGGGGNIVRSNALCRSVTGYAENELAGRDWCELLCSKGDRDVGRDLLDQVRETGSATGQVFALRTRHGRERTVTWHAHVLDQPLFGERSLLLVGHDITDLEQAQQFALQRERLAAIGEMMAGLAHESRNALQRSQACLQRLCWRLHDQPESLDLLERAQQAQDDIVRLFEDVRNYAAPIALAPDRCDLAAVWREAWKQVNVGLLSRDAQLHENTGGIDLRCRVDRFRLGQVFRNILENSFAAVDGPLRVHIICRPTNLAGKDALRVSVRDNGPGLDDEQRRQIFEPFFTTKTKGTGLGMPISKRIVEAHGGQIAVGDAGPPGVEIVILLPRDGPPHAAPTRANSGE
jgi:PAS domain S-box-containing protein